MIALNTLFFTYLLNIIIEIYALNAQGMPSQVVNVSAINFINFFGEKIRPWYSMPKCIKY